LLSVGFEALYPITASTITLVVVLVRQALKGRDTRTLPGEVASQQFRIGDQRACQSRNAFPAFSKVVRAAENVPSLLQITGKLVACEGQCLKNKGLTE